jgi:DNA-3-methyladenine glycosylase II
MQDLTESLEVLGRDKRMAALIATHGPADIVRGAKPFEALVRSIIHQQVSGAAAATISARFRALYPKGVFPTPEAVRDTPAQKLREAGLSGQKASYIVDLATKFADGTIKHKQLRTMQTAELIEHLVQVKGIGVWSAHMFLIFTLGRLDVLPVGDLGVRKGFQAVYNLAEMPSAAEIEKLAKPWRAHASVAAWYLWRAADAQKLVPKKPAQKAAKKKR